ncbi:MAG: hypothetical protein HY074_04955 [Deltaproteobacteria bacterium]|nr:hypothetical protein [Deltaproteobacteria bacterium]
MGRASGKVGIEINTLTSGAGFSAPRGQRGLAIANLFPGRENNMRPLFTGKPGLLVMAVLCAAVVVLAARSAVADSTKIFDATVDWHWSQDFGSVVTEGARLNAIEEAFRKCRAAGHALCTLGSVEQTSSGGENDGQWHLRYEAVIQALDGLPLIKGQVFTNSMSVHNEGSVENLASMAAKSTALENALGSCVRSGSNFCVILGLNYTEVNQVHADGHNYTTATASVQGYSLNDKYLKSLMAVSAHNSGDTRNVNAKSDEDHSATKQSVVVAGSQLPAESPVGSKQKI